MNIRRKSCPKPLLKNHKFLVFLFCRFGCHFGFHLGRVFRPENPPKPCSSPEWAIWVPRWLFCLHFGAKLTVLGLHCFLFLADLGTPLSGLGRTWGCRPAPPALNIEPKTTQQLSSSYSDVGFIFIYFDSISVPKMGAPAPVNRHHRTRICHAPYFSSSTWGWRHELRP